MTIVLRRLIANPVFAGTLIFMLGGWVVSTVCVFLKKDYIAGTTWFLIFYLLALGLALLWGILTNVLYKYRLALLTMIGMGLTLNVGNIGYYINANVAELQAVSAGLIFVEIAMFVWVLVLGSGPGTYLAELCGMGMDAIEATHRIASSRSGGINRSMSMSGTGRSRGLGTSSSMMNTGVTGGDSFGVNGRPETASETMYARALYSYTANPDDPNEVSFAKDEIMVIVDSNGKWWQVKKSDGTVGIAPSNYLSENI